MNKTLRFLLTIFSIMPFVTIGQNMVHNPSFEEKASCPEQPNELYRCNEWESTNYMSYFNSCYASAVTVPLNYISYTPAFSGQAYVGTYYYSYTSSIQREYLTGTLTQLQVGNCYKVTIHLWNAHFNTNFQYSTNGW